MEILSVNIQCCSFSKRKMEKSENVLVSNGKLKKKEKMHWLSQYAIISEMFRMEG